MNLPVNEPMNLAEDEPVAPRYSGGLFGLLSGALLLAICLWMVRAHWETIDIDPVKETAKVRLHEQVLANEAKDPYQYKLWLVTLAFERVQAWTGEDLSHIFLANTLLSLLFLVLAHHLWLRSLVDPPAALVGGILLGALANVLFLTYFHHAYEFWGIALFCVLLRGIQKGWDWRVLSAVCLVTGLVWEKHAFLAVLWGLLQLRRGRPFAWSFLRGLVMLACALAVTVFVRVHLGAQREHVDGDTYLHVQEWAKVLWFQLPFVLPFLLIFLMRWKVMPTWVRLLWLYLPVLIAAYAYKNYILHEVRSFWALAPVFTATVACWLAADVMHAPQRPAQGGGSDPA